MNEMKRLGWGNLEASVGSLPCFIIPLSRCSCLNSGSAPDLCLAELFMKTQRNQSL